MQASLVLFMTILLASHSAFAADAPATATPLPPAAALKVSFEVSRTGTLTHHVLCLAGAIQCAAKEYEQLWQKIGLDAGDKKLLEEVRSFDHALRRKRFGEDWSNQPSVFPFPKRDQDGHMRLRAEASISKSLGELEKKAAVWMTPEEQKLLSKVWSQFDHRFESHWKSAGPALQAKREQLAERQAALQGFVSMAHRFLQSDWPADKALPIYLVDRPSDGRLSHAEWLGDLAELEVSEADTPADLVRIAAIQAVRALYANAPLQTHRNRQRALSSIESDALLPAFGLLDDALAYSLTDGVLMPTLKEKTRTRPSELVGRLTALLSPSMVSDFPSAVLNSSLVAKYVGKIALAEEKELSAPRHALRFVDVAFDRPLTDARRELTRVIGAERVNGYSPMDAAEIVAKFAERRSSFMSVVWLARGQDLSRLARHSAYFDEATLAAVKAQAQKTPSFVYGVKRDVSSPAYLFVGESVADYRRLFERFKEAPRAFLGPMP